MLSLNCLSRRAILLLVLVPACHLAFAQSAGSLVVDGNTGIWALVGLLALLGTWWLGKKEAGEAERLLKDHKKKLESLKATLTGIEQQLKVKNQEIESLEQKYRDALELKENALADAELKGQFVAMMGQQMREPLNEISASVQALSNALDDDELQDHLYEIENAANELVVFINDILDQFKVEAGKVVLEERLFEVRTLIERVRDHVEAESSCSLCHTEIQIHPRVPVRLIGDAACLRHILTQLFQCVMDTGNVADVRLSVASQDLFLRNATLKFTIEGKICGDNDTGNKLESLMPGDEPYLKNIQRLVNLQSGKMIAKMGDHGHLVVQVWLPFVLPGNVELSADRPADRKDKELSKTLSGFHILVAEDNKITQVVVEKVLRDRGAEVCTVTNGREAVGQFKRRRFDLVIMDINMPVMDGYQAVSKIRSLEQGREPKVPIIALTSSVLLTTKEKALLHGMDEYVGKPFSIEDLMDKVHYFLTELNTA